jgi:hypothetical protein
VAYWTAPLPRANLDKGILDTPEKLGPKIRRRGGETCGRFPHSCGYPNYAGTPLKLLHTVPIPRFGSCAGDADEVFPIMQDRTTARTKHFRHRR